MINLSHQIDSIVEKNRTDDDRSSLDKNEGMWTKWERDHSDVDIH